MLVSISSGKEEAGRLAAEAGAKHIREALSQKREAHIILATGTSQFEMLFHLVKQPDINWKQVTAFHLDEYVGIPPGHAASFRRYLKERFVDALPVPLRTMRYINGNAEPESECERLGDLLAISSSMSPSWASARTAISRSTIRRPISRRRKHTSSCGSTRRAGGSS